jgi:hypothetical protein
MAGGIKKPFGDKTYNSKSFRTLGKGKMMLRQIGKNNPT